MGFNVFKSGKISCGENNENRHVGDCACVGCPLWGEATSGWDGWKCSKMHGHLTTPMDLRESLKILKLEKLKSLNILWNFGHFTFASLPIPPCRVRPQTLVKFFPFRHQIGALWIFKDFYPQMRMLGERERDVRGVQIRAHRYPYPPAVAPNQRLKKSWKTAKLLLLI